VYLTLRARMCVILYKFRHKFVCTHHSGLISCTSTLVTKNETLEFRKEVWKRQN